MLRAHTITAGGWRAAIGALALCAAAAVAADGAGTSSWRIRSGLRVEDLGTPVQFAGEQGRAVFRSATTGDVHMLSLYLPYVGLQGQDRPFQIHDLNLTTNEAAIVPGIVGRPGPCGFLLHSNGKVYIGTARPCALLEYDPATRSARSLGRLSDNYYHGVQTFAEGKDGNIYYGTYGRSAGRYNFGNGQVESFGVLGGKDGIGWGYIFSIGSDGASVFCGMGKAPYYLCVYDIANKTTRDYFKPDTQQATKDRYVVKGKDGNFYYNTLDGYVFLLGPGEPARKRMSEVALETERAYATPEGALERFGVQIDLSQANPSNFNGGAVTVLHKKADAAQWTTSTVTGMPIFPCAVKRLVRLPDGRLLGTTPFVGPAFILNPADGKVSCPGMLPCSVYDAIESDGKVYLAGYVNAFAQYDPAAAWTVAGSHAATRSGNPMSITLGTTAKYNYFLAVGKDGRIYAAGHHERESVGGSLAWYDPKTGGTGGVRDELLRHDVSDLVALNGGALIVLSAHATDAGGRGRIVVYDAVRHAVAAVLDPLPDLADAGKIFAAGEDMIVGAVRQSASGEGAKAVCHVYKLNVRTGALLFRRELPGRFFTGASEMDLLGPDARFEVGPDGCGWLFVDNAICRIHPDDGRLEKVFEMAQKGRLLFTGADLYVYNGGRVFFGGFSQLLRIGNVFAAKAGAPQ